MFNSIVQKLNKSFGGTNPDESEKMSPKNRTSSNPEPNAKNSIENESPAKSNACISTSDPKESHPKRKKPCNLCKGAGCCVKCAWMMSGTICFTAQISLKENISFIIHVTISPQN